MKDRNAALNAMKPYLREGDWDTAVFLALDEIHDRLADNLGKATGDGASGSGGGALSSVGRGWEDFKRRAADGLGRGGGGGGGGGGMLGGRFFQDLFGGDGQDFSPVGLLTLSLLFGAMARSSLQRRRYDRFEAKLAAIEAQRYKRTGLVDPSKAATMVVLLLRKLCF